MPKLPRKLLLPGQYYITNANMILETLLGSCVAVCIYNTKNGFTAMNHFMNDKPADPNDLDTGRYGTTSTEYIIKKLLDIDPDVNHYKAELYGGAAVIKTQNSADIGKKNLRVAIFMLQAYGIRIVKKEIAGTRGRRINFDTTNNSIKWRYTGDIPRKYPPMDR